VELSVVKDTQEFVSIGHDWCQKKITANTKRIFLPAGATSIPLYQYWEKTTPDYLKGKEFTQVDEIVSGPKTGAFATFFKTELPSYQNQFVGLQQQMDLPDVVMLGLGTNGHIAFHEPHVRDDFYRGFVNLDEDTCENLGVAYRTRGFTFGARCFLQAKSILLMVRGAKKKEILHSFLNGPQPIPASLIKGHKDLTVLCDQESMGEI
jgi:6-phosphogluconolactonase/glucosamine-6-phosphate isomerase/deaminase